MSPRSYIHAVWQLSDSGGTPRYYTPPTTRRFYHCERLSPPRPNAFGKQPQIAHWNLLQLANALRPLLEKEEPLQAGLDRYIESFQTSYQTMMAKKLGLRFFVEHNE